MSDASNRYRDKSTPPRRRPRGARLREQSEHAPRRRGHRRTRLPVKSWPARVVGRGTRRSAARSTQPWMPQARRAGRQLAMPAIMAGNHRGKFAAGLSRQTAARTARHSRAQPDAANSFPTSHAGFLLAAFARLGHRIGYGAGHTTATATIERYEGDHGDSGFGLSRAAAKLKPCRPCCNDVARDMCYRKPKCSIRS